MNAPNDSELEFGAIATLLQNHADAAVLCEQLTEDDFFSPKCRIIFRAAKSVIAAGGKSTDIHEITSHLQHHQGIGKDIQASELLRITYEYVVFIGIPGNVARLQELSRLRKLQFFATELNRRITADPCGVFEYAKEAIQNIADGAGAGTSIDDVFIHVSDMKDTPPEWLIKYVLEKNCLAELFGPVGSLKTFMAIDLGLCIASGAPFHRHRVKDPGPVLFIIGEGRSGFKRRLRAWGLMHKVDIDSLPVLVSRQPAQMTQKESVESIKRAIRKITEKYGSPKLIVIDTLNRNFGPGDENSTQDMTAYGHGCDELKAVCESSVLTVHHSGLAEKERARGNSALFAAIEYCYRIDVNRDETINLVFLKCKDQPKPGPRTFARKVIDLGITDDEGEAVTSCILEEVALNTETGQDRTGRGSKQKIMQDILTEMVNDRDGELIDLGKPPEGRVSAHVWLERCKDAGCTKNDLSRNKKRFFVKDEFVYEKLYS
jgi:hypothetical protein